MPGRIVATCMDRRLPQKIEELGGGIHVSNAGCNIASMGGTIAELVRRNPGVKEIVARVHTDCGAMGAVDDARRGNESKYGERTRDTLFSQFKLLKWADRAVLETEVNAEVQLKALQKLREAVLELTGRNVGVRVEVIDTSAIAVPDMDHERFALLVSKPSEVPVPEIISRAGLEQFATYSIQLLSLNEALGDVGLTINNIGVHRVVFGFASKEEETEAKANANSLLKSFPGAVFETVDISA